MKKLLILSTLLLAMTSSMFTKSKKITIHSIDPKLTISFYHVKDGKKFVDNQGGTAIFDLKMNETPNAVSITLNGKEYFINNLASYLEYFGFNRNQPGEHSWALWINYIDPKKTYVEYKIYKDNRDMGLDLHDIGYQYDDMLLIYSDYNIDNKDSSDHSGVIKSVLTDKSTAIRRYNDTTKWIADTIAENIKKFQKFCENRFLAECWQSPYNAKNIQPLRSATVTNDSNTTQQDNATSTIEDQTISDTPTTSENDSIAPQKPTSDTSSLQTPIPQALAA